MKILDLGCHDGYISLWLGRQLGTDDIHIDGLDLHPAAAASAAKRLDAAGIPGEIICADALTAPDRFQLGSYDAVICYELIEHVPDVNELLAVCELMCRPAGRIYVSTPAGTFGSGGNRQHLRALRPHDLADLLRRRGDLTDMDIQSGVTVASYTPTRRDGGDIAIFCGPGWGEPWSPHDIATKGLGGSETAAVHVARHLSEMGYVVTVYGEVQPCCYRQVLYRPWQEFDPAVRRTAVISSRIPQLFDRPVNCRSRLLWVHDIDCQDQLTASRAGQIDHILAVSDWHADRLRSRYPFARDRIRAVRNGIDHRLFREGEVPERARRVVYTSSPDRGLDILLELWPQVLQQVPDAELHHAHADVYDRVAEQVPAVQAHRRRIEQLSGQPGVKYVGSLSQPEVAKLMRGAMVWAHPSWASVVGEPFLETSCIGAMEAMAAGCLVVASSVGALRETARVGRLVENEILSDRWRDVFVRMIVEGLTNRDVQAWAQAEGPAAAANLRWDQVAGQIAGLIEGEADAIAGRATVG